ncbi:MAG: 3-deoxy-7-phosphoheptulonate synthase [Bacillaceae bacterium G1]|nr:MAG: 3-deoxy-7-phosphoheptulonate synthase [Bacillaceae bacterium G1]
MIVVMHPSAKPESIEKVKQRLEEAGLGVHISTGENRTIIGVLGDKRKVNIQAIEVMDDVEKIVHIEAPFKLANKQFHPEPTIVTVGDVQIGGRQLVVMAGPCSVESREQLLETAAIVKEGGAQFLRGGAFKPRSSPYSFQGLGEEGLKILAEAREKTGLKIVSEVMDTDSLPIVAEYVDILQIGARNMQNFPLLKAVGRLNKPVLLKRGLSATIEEWLMAAEYILNEGNHQVILCERGIRTFETYTRNTLDLSTVPVIKHMSHLPIIIDPSHGTGKWRYVTPMARAAVAAGADGLIVEVHPQPEKAWSDGPQSLNPEAYAEMMREVRKIAAVMGRDS